MRDRRIWLWTLVTLAPLFDYLGMDPVGEAVILGISATAAIFFWQRMKKLQESMEEFCAWQEEQVSKCHPETARELRGLGADVRRLTDTLGTRFVP